jgi:hypothetical protein
MFPGFTSKLSESILASATSITVKSDIVRVTGNTQIDTIIGNFGGGFSGFLVLIPTDGAVTLGAGGNINVGIAMGQNRAVFLVYSKLAAKWFINSGV